MKTTKEYYQVTTSDRKHYFSEHLTIDKATEHITNLLDAGLPYSEYDYEILHVIEVRTENVISYPVAL